MSRNNFAVDATLPDGSSDLAPIMEQTSAQFSFWINCVGAPLVLVEKDTHLVRQVNDCALSFFRVQRDNLQHAHMDQLVGAYCANMLAQIWSIPSLGKLSSPFLLRGNIAGDDRFLLFYVSSVRVDGEDLRLYTLRDAPPQDSAAMADWSQSVLEMLNWLPFGFEISDRSDQIQFVNSHFYDLFGYQPYELEDIENWWRLAYPDPDYREMAKRKWETEISIARAENREMTPFDLDVQTAAGATRIIQFRHRAIGEFNVNLYLDVTTERQHARSLMRLAETDPLTGVMNRRSFFEHVRDRHQHEETAAGNAVLMLDIDHFKHINDVYGHAAGDIVLKEFTRRCQGMIRGGDLFARTGGEEFAILLRNVDAERAEDVAQRMRLAVNASPFELGDEKVMLTVSIGGALCDATDIDIDIEPALSRADKALYAAKHAGRDKVIMDIGA